MCQARGSWAAHCFCISPGPNGPRSPPFLNEPQSLRISAYLANASSVLPSAAILSMYVWSSAMAASPLTFAVDSLVRRETGLREPLNLMRRWRAAYFGISVGCRGGARRGVKSRQVKSSDRLPYGCLLFMYRLD